MKYIKHTKLLFNNINRLAYTVCDVYDGFIAFKDTNNMLGTMMLDGTIIIPPSFSDIEPFFEIYISRYKLKYGLIDKSAVEILKPTYTDIKNFINNTAIVCLDNKYGVINDVGKIIIPCIHNKIERDDNSFIVTNDNKQVIYDNNGKVIIEASDRYNYDFLGDNFYKLYDLKNKCFGVITSAGITIKAKYDRVRYLNSNRFLVYKGLKKYIVNTKNKIVLKLPSNCIVYDSGDKDIFIVESKHNTDYGLIDDKGKVTVEDNYNDLRVEYGYIIGTKNNEYDIIDLFGNVLTTIDKKYSIDNIVGDLILLKTFDSSLKNTFFPKFFYKVIYIDGNELIPLLSSKIFLMSDSKLIIDGCLVDLNDEYIDFKYKTIYKENHNIKECLIEFENYKIKKLVRHNK